MGANACTNFATQSVVSAPLSSVSAEEIGNASTETAVKTFLADRSGTRAFTDTDHDGITDYDEVNLYGTDPKKDDSNNNGIHDGAEIIAHTNPLSVVSSTTLMTIAFSKTIAFEDPKTHGKTASTTLIVSTIISGATTTDANGVGHISSMTLSGRAPANSFVTLYIYSEPIVVTLKANESGSWTYTLNKELPDGTHQVFSAITDTGGRVLAKSDPLPFVQTASAITVGSFELLPSQSKQAPTFFGGTSLITMFILLLLVLIIVMVVLGVIARRNKDDGTGTPTVA
jgi:hypothetical protein